MHSNEVPTSSDLLTSLQLLHGPCTDRESRSSIIKELTRRATCQQLPANLDTIENSEQFKKQVIAAILAGCATPIDLLEVLRDELDYVYGHLDEEDRLFTPTILIVDRLGELLRGHINVLAHLLIDLQDNVGPPAVDHEEWQAFADTVERELAWRK